jgi:hypothetical protein
LVVWLVLVVVVPVPLVVVGRGHLPAGALAQLAAATLTVGVLDRGDGIIWLLAAFLAGQALIWAFVAWFAARLVVGGLAALGRRALGVATVIVVTAAVTLALVVPIYRSPFHPFLSRQTLLQVYG